MRTIRWLWVAAFLPAMSAQRLQGCELPTHCKTGLQRCNVTQTDYSYRQFPYLSVNSIDTFINPREITVLKFDKCGITSLAYTVFYDMNNLKLLTLSGNSLATLDSRVFFSQRELDQLDLSHNELISIDSLFSSQERLKILLLDHNKLRSFKVLTFIHLTNLIYLDLSYNSLYHLPNNPFVSQEHLETLLLDDNRLTAVSVKLLTPLRSIKQFGLSYNPLVCNCELQLTVLWCEERALGTGATCRNQSSRGEVHWTELKHYNNCPENEVPDVPSTTDANLTTSDGDVVSDTSSHLLLFIPVTLTVLLMMCCGLSAVWYYKRRPGNSAAPGGDTPVYDDIATVRDYDYIHDLELNMCSPPEFQSNPQNTSSS